MGADAHDFSAMMGISVLMITWSYDGVLISTSTTRTSCISSPGLDHFKLQNPTLESVNGAFGLMVYFFPSGIGYILSSYLIKGDRLHNFIWH